MEIPSGGGAVAEVNHRHIVVVAIMAGIGNAYGVGDLGRNRHDVGQIGGVLRHLATFVVAGDVQQNVLHGNAAPQLGAGFPERGDEPIGLLQIGNGSDVARFLALNGSERADAALALQLQQAFVKTPR